MPVWPAGSVGTTNMDAGSDAPANARSDIKQAVDDVNSIIAARGIASGIASLDAAALVPIGQIPIVRNNNGLKVISTPGAGSWTVPAGVYRAKAMGAGGGGGGGYTTPGTGGDDGGGGGAGAVVIKYFDVVPGSVFTFTVGAKGTGHGIGSDGNGTDGTDTTITSPASATPASCTITAGKGLGGLGAPADRFGGGGGAASDTDATTGRSLLLPGGAGISGGSRGGAGGGNALSSGAAGGTGYGGAGGFGSGHGTAANDGLGGVVAFEW